MAYSAACTVLQGAKRRLLCASSSVMVHPPSQCVYGNAAHLQSALEELLASQDKLWACYDRSPPDLVAGWRRDGLDHWFTAEEALAAGLADQIIPDFPPAAGTSAPTLAVDNVDRPAEDLLIDLLSRARVLFKDEQNFEQVLRAFSSVTPPALLSGGG
jgi:Clp protease